MTSLDKDLMKIKKSLEVPEDISPDDDQGDREDGVRRGDPHCYECKVKYRDPSENDLIMYLHALRYQVSEDKLGSNPSGLLIQTFLHVRARIGVMRPSCQHGLMLIGLDTLTSIKRD